MKAVGYRVRFRLDALAPIENWEGELRGGDGAHKRGRDRDAHDRRADGVNPSALRTAAEKNGRYGSTFNYISTVDPSGFKHRTEHDFHVSIFRRVKEKLASGMC